MFGVHGSDFQHRAVAMRLAVDTVDQMVAVQQSQAAIVDYKSMCLRKIPGGS